MPSTTIYNADTGLLNDFAVLSLSPLYSISLDGSKILVKVSAVPAVISSCFIGF